MTNSDEDCAGELTVNVEQWRALERGAAHMNGIMTQWAASMTRVMRLFATAMDAPTDEASGMTLKELLSYEEDG